MMAMRGSLNGSSGRIQDPPGGGELEIIRWSKFQFDLVGLLWLKCLPS